MGLCARPCVPGADPGFGLEGAKFGEGSGDRLGPQLGPGQSPGGGTRGTEPPRSSWN